MDDSIEYREEEDSELVTSYQPSPYMDMTPYSSLNYEYSSSDNSMHPSDIGSARPSEFSPMQSYRDGHKRQPQFIPTELARSQIKKVENEMKKMHKRHCQLLKDMDENYTSIEKETHQRYIEFINKWKEQVKKKIAQYRKVIESLTMEINELRDFTENNVSNLQEKNAKLMQEKKELLVKYDSDMTEKERLREESIQSLQSAYEKQIDRMQKDKHHLTNQLEELQAEKYSLETYNTQLLEIIQSNEKELETHSRTAENATKEVCQLVLEKILVEVSGDETEYNKVKNRFEELKKKRSSVKRRIANWIKEFERMNGRPCQNSDKEQIKGLYAHYVAINKELETLQKKLQGIRSQNVSVDEKSSRRARSFSPSPALNVSAESYMSKQEPETTPRDTDRLKGLKGRNLIKSPMIANSIITTAELQNVKAERDSYKEEVSKLKEYILGSLEEANKHILTNLEKEKEEWKAKAQEMQKNLEADEMLVDKLKSEYDYLMSKITDTGETDIATLKAHLAYCTSELTSTKEKFLALKSGSFQKKLNEDLEEHSNEVKLLKDNLRRLEEENKNLVNQKEQLQLEKDQALKTYNQLNSVEKEKTEIQSKLQVTTKELQELKQYFTVKDQELKDSLRQRKLLHNQLEDLRGKIRVFCRVRPMNQSETKKGCRSILNICDDFTLNCETKPGDVKPFSYDSVFGPSATQSEVFEDTKRLVQSAVDGFNVCIFAYGQTGSGKTYTIQGERDNPGITPLAIQEIFNILESMNSYTWEVSCFMVELYMYNLIDLFRPKGNKETLSIRKDMKGMVYVPEALKHTVSSSQELIGRFHEGIASRHTGKTLMNNSSSRSHLIFTILITVTNNETGQRTVGKLSLVDLAGSERVRKSEATAERLREGQAINKSLTALGDVISALSSHEAHIPYRNNKLTMLMSDSLGGSAKTLMFVNVSPASYNREETMMSLYYASRVKLITNEPIKNIESKEMSKMKQEYMLVAAERDKYKKALENKGSEVQE